MYPWQTLARLADEKVVAIIREGSAVAAREAAHRVLDTGLGVLEVSLTTPGGLEVVADLRRDYPEATVGAGTILDEATARLAILAGAQFLVSPTLVTEVLATALRYGIVAVPGCSSPTEMVQALQLGAGAVKVFPASAWTPQDLRAVRQALPQLPLVPTGGITVRSAPGWIAAGAIAVGMGSGLTSGDPVEAKQRVGDLRVALEALR